MTAELIEYTIPTVSRMWPGEAIDAKTLEQELFMVSPPVSAAAAPTKSLSWLHVEIPVIHEFPGSPSPL